VKPLRLGVLGAARIAELAIVKPAHATGTRLVAVAARNPDRAAAFAAYGVQRVANPYTELLADPEIEAVYNPLPNAPNTLHSTRVVVHRGAGPSATSRQAAPIIADLFVQLPDPIGSRSLLHAPSVS
jgi:hypothetical protein